MFGSRKNKNKESEERKFKKGDKVFISSNKDEVIRLQKEHGGYSPQRMESILGKDAIVLHCYKKYATIFVEKHHFDFSVDLLERVCSSVPQPIGDPQVYPEPLFPSNPENSTSRPKPSVEYISVTENTTPSIIQLPEPPVDSFPNNGKPFNRSEEKQIGTNKKCQIDEISIKSHLDINTPPKDSFKESIGGNISGTETKFKTISLMPEPISWTYTREQQNFENITQKQLKSIQKNNEVKNDRLLCKICRESPNNIRFDCGHTFCQPCSLTRVICNVCGKTTIKKERFYLN